MSDRFAMLKSWLESVCGPGIRVEPASEDASFRRYFRAFLPNGDTRVVMDAPPERENCAPFVRLANVFVDLGVHVPHIFACDIERGFLLLEDLGSRHYLDELDAGSVHRLYSDALSTLMMIQACGSDHGLQRYDRSLFTRELKIFTEWLVSRHLGLEFSREEHATLRTTFESLIKSALEQPQVLVHRDFHSRNLLLVAPPSPGVIDFQDAVWGPVTYDLVSLLRDCYIDWPLGQVENWASGYRERALQSGVLSPEHEVDFMRWFDWMGMQRHLKAAGIFARLYRRDGKPGYLADIPRTLGYVVQVAERYPELQRFGQIVQTRVLPRSLFSDRLLGFDGFVE